MKFNPWLLAALLGTGFLAAVGLTTLASDDDPATAVVGRPVELSAVATIVPTLDAPEASTVATDAVADVDPPDGVDDEPSITITPAADGDPDDANQAADPDADAADADAADADAADADADDADADAADADDPADDDATEPANEPDPDEVVPESKAVVKGGKIYLEGAVPSREAADEIVAIAAAIMGADNVIDNYIIDERADDPNLGNIRVDDTVLFETNSAQIRPEFEPLLNQALALLTTRPSVTMTIIGHTDSKGPADYNLWLSTKRAEAVKTYLEARGVDGDRLSIVGRGEADPVADNATEAGRELNRRIQVIIENLLVD